MRKVQVFTISCAIVWCLFSGLWTFAAEDSDDLTPIDIENGWSFVNTTPGNEWMSEFPLPGGKSGDMPFSTESNWPADQSDVWMTQLLELPKDYQPVELEVRYKCRDTMWLYINGKFAFRADTQVDSLGVRKVKATLQPGKNIIAVRCQKKKTKDVDQPTPGEVLVELHTTGAAGEVGSGTKTKTKVSGAGGTILVSAGADGVVGTWNLRTGKPGRKFIGHTGTVQRAILSPDGKTLYSSAADRTIRVWDVKTGKTTQILTGHTDKVGALDLSADGKYLYSGCGNGILKVWDLSNKDIFCLNTITDRLRREIVCIHADSINKTFAVGSGWDLAIHDGQTGEQLQSVNAGGLSTYRVAASPGGDFYTRTPVGGATMKMYSSDGQLLLSLDKAVPRVELSFMRFIPGTTQIAIAGSDMVRPEASRGMAHVVIYDYSKGVIVKRWTICERGGVWSMAISPNGASIATGHSDGIIRV